MERSCKKAVMLFLICIFSPSFSEASNDIEEDLQKRFQESRQIVVSIRQKLAEGLPVAADLVRLKTLAADVRASDLLLQDKFRSQESEVAAIGPKARDRQRIMSEGYHQALEEYLSLIDSIPPDGTVQQSTLDALQSLLDKVVYKKKRPTYGTLPCRNLNYPSKEPNPAPAIKPAYKGGNKTVSPDDLKDTPEAPISEEIATLAESLNWNPVSIYEYVKNTIETEWYWGCMKGAEETLHQKSGNDCDQATLLIALLRASGFPSRCVRGTIEFFAGKNDPIDKIINLLGIEDPLKIAEHFKKAGIPYIMVGGTIRNFRIEHLWVESQIPYANYRGNIIDGQGKTWLGLDTSIKVKGYTYNESYMDIFQLPAIATQLSALKDEYLNTIRTQTPLEYLEGKLTAGGYQLPELIRTKTLIPEIMNILPASMQFKQTAITNEYTEIPEELKHKVRFRATDTLNKELFDTTLDALELSNKAIALTYEPENVEDQQIIDSYGGLDNTPAYLVRLRPVLKVDGERIIIGTNGLPMGSDHTLTIELLSPNGTEKITSTHITGNLAAIGIVSQRAIDPQQTAMSEEDDAEAILFKETNRYIDRWNRAEDELASLFRLTMARPIPTVVTIGGVIDVTYLLDIPHGYAWKGVYVDADLRAAEVTPSYYRSPQEAGDRQKTFMQLSALQGSILENRIFEDDFQVESISTAKLFEIANSNQAPILSIDKTNISTVLPTLPFDDNIKEDINNAVNQNYTVKIPSQVMTYLDWTGIGYIKENPTTGESGYMLTGMIAGGMTAVSLDKWTNQSLREKFSRPNKTYTTIVITSPKNGAVVSTPVIEVKGTVVDPSVKVEVNGIPAVVTGNTFTATGIPLKEGVNNITATETNTAGKTASDTVFITYRIPIIVSITFPYDGANLSVTPIDVEGIVSDPAASVQVNGVKATVGTDGRFIASGVALSEGMNQITANAMKSNGQSGSYSVTVNYHTAPVPPMYISITSPQNSATINRPSVMVKGTVTTSAQEVSIKVNGILADIYGNQFVANNVPLTEGNNTIIANALDSNGAVARAEINVIASTTGPYITLSANITSGIPPLTTYFSVSTGIPNPVMTYQIDFEGDGEIDYTGDTFENINHAYTAEGIFYPIVTVTDNQGNTYTDTIAITVLNKAEIDALLKGKWEGMKGALTKGAINEALRYFTRGSQDEYREIFDLLTPQLQSLVAGMREITVIEVSSNVAEYYIRRPQRGMEISYFIYFMKDADGVWKIERF